MTLCRCGICYRYIPMSVCVHPSQVGVLLKRLNGLSWFLARRLPSTCPTLCFKEIWITPKIRILPFGTLSQTVDLQNFAMASGSSVLSVKMMTGNFIYHTCDTASWAYGTSLLIVIQTSHIPSVSVECHEAVDNISAYIDQRCLVHLWQLILVCHLRMANANFRRC